MNKFGKPTDEEYRTVRDVVVHMVEAGPSLILAQNQCK
jgi:hypothetical protein